MPETIAAAPRPGIQLEPYQVILRPLVTEKGMHRATRNNQYSFEINPLANKLVVREAVEALFDVTVIKVRTQSRRGKPRRYRLKFGQTKAWKKAIVTVREDQKINFF